MKIKNEIIERIREVYYTEDTNNKNDECEFDACYMYKYEGYEITTDKAKYLVVINNDQQCCEHWGYLTSEDDFEKFIGNELVEVKTDSSSGIGNDFFETKCTCFVDFVTTKGTLQFVLYNEHNGYYGHKVIISRTEEGFL